MVLASLNGQLIVDDTDDTVHNTDLLLLAFKHRSLFDMQFYDCSNIVTFHGFSVLPSDTRQIPVLHEV